MAKQLVKQSKGGFSGNTKENPKNETCNAIELRRKKVLTPLAPKAKKTVHEVVVEEVEIDDEVEKNSDEGVVENVTARFSRLFYSNYFIACIILIVCIFICLCI